MEENNRYRFEEEDESKTSEESFDNEELDLDATVTISWDATGEKKCVYNGVREYAK